MQFSLFYLMALAGASVSCGTDESNTRASAPLTQLEQPRYERGPAGPTGPTGLAGNTGSPGSSCTVQDHPQGAEIVCTDGTRQVIYDAKPQEEAEQPVKEIVGAPVVVEEKPANEGVAHWVDTASGFSWHFESPASFAEAHCPEGYHIPGLGESSGAKARGIFEQAKAQDKGAACFWTSATQEEYPMVWCDGVNMQQPMSASLVQGVFCLKTAENPT